MSWLALIVELVSTLVKAFGFAASAKQTASERATGAAQQRAEELSNEAVRIEKAAHAGLADASRRVPDPFDRDAAT